MIENKNWALLPSSAKAVYPTIACYCDAKGNSFPGEQTIGILSGLSDKKVREGIRALDDLPSFTSQYYVTRRGNKSKKYHISFPPSNVKGASFPFHKHILESGIWQELKPTAKALYPAMRFFGFFDIDIYNEVDAGNEYVELADFSEVYADRKYDYCCADKDQLVIHAGISNRSLYTALQDLKSNCLVFDVDNWNGWRVYIHPEEHFKRSYLNAKIKKSYNHLLK